MSSVEECYSKLNGDLEGARARMMGKEELLLKILKLVPQHGQQIFDEMTEALEAGDIETAHRHAHSLKGTGRDLGLTHLISISEKMQFALQDDDNGNTANLDYARSLYPDFATEFNKTIEAINDLD